MFILLAIIAGTVIGAIWQLVIKPAEVRGVILSGATGAAVAAAVYAGATWLGWGEDNPMTWLASVGGSLVVSLVATIAITKSRAAHDAAKAKDLGIA